MEQLLNTYGLYLDLEKLRQCRAVMKAQNAQQHEDIVIVDVDKRISMTLEEFIEKLGA